MTDREMLSTLLTTLVLVVLMVALGCGGGTDNFSLDTAIGQPNGGIPGSTRDLIMFVSTRTGLAQVYTIDSAGVTLRRLTARGSHDQTPAWSPNGRQIIFASSEGTRADIWRANVDNTTVTNRKGKQVYFYDVTDGRGFNMAPVWSVNDRIAFHSHRDSPELEIYTINPDGTDLQRLTNNNWSDNSPKWSADGTRILFSSNRENGTPEIFVMNADGSNPVRLTTTQQGWASLAPAWSPDNTRIAYVLQQPNGDRDIYVMDADGTNQRRLTSDGRGNHRPTWSPDGTRIAYEHWGREPVADIWVMDADGGNPTRLTTHGTEDSQPAWSPSTI